MKLIIKKFYLILSVVLGLMTSSPVGAAIITFATDPFEGSTALTTPGRQVVGNELFTEFAIASDVFAFEPTVFGIGETINFANATVENLPTSGLNVIVLQTFDNDADPTTPFAAGTAANLIATQLTSPAPGFFIYFNSGLDLPRLVYSTDLSDNQSDLKILARLTNLGGQAGRDLIPTLTAANFQVASVPETAGNSMFVIAAMALLAVRSSLRRRSALKR